MQGTVFSPIKLLIVWIDESWGLVVRLREIQGVVRVIEAATAGS